MDARTASRGATEYAMIMALPCPALRRRNAAIVLLLALILFSRPIAPAVRDSPAGPRVDFDQDVRPMLVKHCFACHGPSKQKGGLRFDRKSAALKGGDSGPAIVPRQECREPDRATGLGRGRRPGDAAEGPAADVPSRSPPSGLDRPGRHVARQRRTTTTAATGGRCGR